MSGYQKPEDLINEHGLLKQITRAVVERALQAEMDAHLGHAKHESAANYVATGHAPYGVKTHNAVDVTKKTGNIRHVYWETKNRENINVKIILH